MMKQNEGAKEQNTGIEGSKLTPSRSVRAARSSPFNERHASIFSSVELIASHTRSDMPGPKLGLTD